MISVAFLVAQWYFGFGFSYPKNKVALMIRWFLDAKLFLGMRNPKPS